MRSQSRLNCSAARLPAWPVGLLVSLVVCPGPMDFLFYAKLLFIGAEPPGRGASTFVTGERIKNLRPLEWMRPNVYRETVRANRCSARYCRDFARDLVPTRCGCAQPRHILGIVPC
jgi:hypothetical protein